MAIAAGLSEQEALIQFQEQHPDLGSIRLIAELDPQKFIDAYAPAFEGGAEQASQIHQLAYTLNEKAILIWANLNDTVSSPFFQRTRFSNVPQSFTDYQKSIPDYERLFRKQSYQECDDCRSILSPAAYFVDLMRFLEKKILENSTIPADCDLKSRRPDLWTIPLNCENTNDMLPYIDLVNEVLEQFVKNPPDSSIENQSSGNNTGDRTNHPPESTRETHADVYRRLATTQYPLNLPFNLPLQEIRTYLKPLKTSLYSVYNTFRPQPSPSELTQSLALPEPEPALPFHPSRSDAAEPSSELFSELFNLGLIREMLGLSPEDWAILTAPELSPEALATLYGVTGLREDNLAGLERVDYFLDRTGLSRRDLDRLLLQDLDRSEVALEWTRQFFINQNDAGRPPMTIRDRTIAPQQTEEIIENLSVTRLDRMQRFLRLSQRLGWSFADLDWALRSLQPAPLSDRVLYLDGDADYIACRDVTHLDVTEFLIEAEICPLRSGMNPILFKGTDGTEVLHFLLYLDGSNTLRLKTPSAEVRSPDPIPVGQVTSLVIAVSAQGVRFNNKTGIVESGTWQAIAPVGRDLNIGKSNDSFYFNGFIQNVRLWQGTEPPEAIAPTAEVSAHPRLLGDWKLDPSSSDQEEQGWLCLDASACQNHGVLIRQQRYLSRSHEGDSPFVPAPQRDPNRVLFSSTFAASTFAASTQPQDWFDTRGNFSTEFDPSRPFRLLDNPAGVRGFGTESTVDHLHSHYVGVDAQSWSNYEFSGRLRATDANAGIGVTALSGYPQTRQYYRLRSFRGRPFELVARTAGNISQLPIRGGTLPILQGNPSSEVRLQANVWFRFRFRVEDTETVTRIRAKVWPEGTPEPEAFQMDAWDDASDRLRQGTIGVWTDGAGTKVFDDFQVVSLPIATATRLTPATLAQLAAIKDLQNSWNLSIDRLAALWYAPKFVGREDGQTFFDQCFNTRGVSQTRWNYPLDRPLRLTFGDTDANPDQERQIRTRLMSALGIPQNELNQLLHWMSGGQSVVTLDTLALTQLSQLAEMRRLLPISLLELLQLLDYLKLRQTTSLSAVLHIKAAVQQLRNAGFSVTEFLQLRQDPSTHPLLARLIASNAERLAATLWNQRRELRGNVEPADDAPLQAALPESRKAIANAVVAAIASLFNTSPAPLQSILQSPFSPLDPEQLWQKLAEDQPNAASLQNLTDCLCTVQWLLPLINKLNLTPAEITGLLNHPEALGVASLARSNSGQLRVAALSRLTIAELSRLGLFKQLQQELQDEQGQLLAWLRSPEQSAAKLAQAIAPLTGWQDRQFNPLATHFGNLFDSSILSRVEWLQRLHGCFKLAQSMGVTISFLIQLADPQTHQFEGFQEQSANLLKVLRATQTDPEAWEKTEKPLRDQLALQKRDALLSLALLKLGSGIRKDPNRLYEFLLIDPQMGSEVQTSRVVQAIASIQLYVQRCFLNLEAGVNPAMIAQDEWEWMKNYRVWEANRKVFLYPENYIEPELRRTKTPIFEELEQELLQGEVAAERVEQIYKNYLDKFKEVADLQIVGSYLHRDRRQNEQDQGILYLIGRTRTQPSLFYYRTLIVDEERWTPWIKIELTINSQFVTPVVAFRRLFIFWTEFIKTKAAVERKATEAEKKDPKLLPDGRYIGKNDVIYNKMLNEPIMDAIDIYQPVVKFSYYNFGKAWVQPQTYLELPNVLSETEHLLTQWQRVYAQTARERLLDSKSAQATPSLLTEKNPQVLQVNPDTAIAQTVEDFGSNAFTLTGRFSPELLGGKSAAVSESDARRELVRPITLVDLDNGRVKVIVTNTIEAIPQIDRSIFRDIRDIIQQAQTLVNRLIAFVNSDNDFNLLSSIDENADRIEERGREIRRSVSEAAEYSEYRSRLDIALASIGETVDRINNFSNQRSENDKAWARRETEQMQWSLNWATNALNEVEPPETSNFRWQSVGLQLLFQVGNTTLEGYRLVGYQRNQGGIGIHWNSFSLVMQYDNTRQGYRVLMNLDTTPPNPQFVVMPPLSKRLEVAIAQASPNPPAIALQLSDVALWPEPLNVQEVRANWGRRKTEAETVLYLPLNRPIPHMQMQLVDARPGLEFSTILENQTDEVRERLLIFYGNTVRTLRNNLTDDKAFQLTFNPTDNAYSYDLDLSPTRLDLTLTKGLSLNDYAEVDRTTPTSRATPELIQQLLRLQLELKFSAGPLTEIIRARIAEVEKLIGQKTDPISADFQLNNPLLSQLPNLEGVLYDVGNQPGWYIFSTNDEQFLIRLVTENLRSPRQLKTTQDRLKLSNGGQVNELTSAIRIDIDTDKTLEARNSNGLVSNAQPPQFQSPPYKFQFIRLNSFAVQTLSENLFVGGVEGLLSLASQRTPERNFSQYGPNNALVEASQVSSTVDFKGANGLYYWEIFFHIPFLIANRLNASHRFDQAQRWYHYLFNPTAREQTENPSDRYWRFLPFRSEALKSLDQILSDPMALAEYREDPGDPHAIARLRPSAYQKAIVMKYIDNLLDWGDHLFEKDDRESINEATMLYVLGYALLGPKPELRPAEKFVEVGTYWHIEQRYRRTGVPEFLLDSDQNSGNGNAPNAARFTPTEMRFNPHNTLATDFCAPENEQFMKYWDRVEDRLYKIRRSLTIEGIFRQLALFAPELDPAALVQSLAGGQGLSAALADQDAQVPFFRFNLLLDKAKDMASTVIDLSAALLSTLQSQDAEQLAILQNNQEQQIHDLTLKVKQSEVDHAEAELEALRVSKEILGTKIDYYTLRLAVFLTPGEATELILRQGSTALLAGKAAVHVSEAIAAMIPDVEAGGSGFAASPRLSAQVGGDDLSDFSEAVANGLEALADTFEKGADLAAKVAEYERRTGEWIYELTTAGLEMKELDQKIAVSELQIQKAKYELAVQEKQIEHSRQVAEFYRSKFTNQALYGWMVSRLSTLQFQAYSLAYSMAKSAEKALQFELPTEESFIKPVHWDASRRGLLAGESLLLELQRMDKFNLDQDRRWLAIQKRISLKQLASSRGDDLAQILQETGRYTFELSEALFNRDYHGHYCRQIKTIGISIHVAANGMTDPYDSVHATLTQTKNKLLLQPDIQGLTSMMDKQASKPDPSIVREDWRSRQQIAISKTETEPYSSKTEADLGIFSLDFVFDNAYFPFENTGAVSEWLLEIPEDTNPSLKFDRIIDIVIHLRYSARSDSGAFKAEVSQLMKQKL